MIMKKIFVLLGLFLSLSPCFAQSTDNSNNQNSNSSSQKAKISDNDMKQLNGLAGYNATIIGYAVYCKFDNNDTKLIYNQYINEITHIPLTDEQRKQVDSTFYGTLKIASDRGVSNSNTTCASFKTEYNKMVATLKSGQLNIDN
jgi:hypothetical protein